MPDAAAAPAGTREAGLFALHGFTEDDTVWPGLLAQAGIAATGILLPGHGWKPCPRGDALPAFVAELAGRLPPAPVDVLGYSLGGRLALRFALDHPHRVRRLILIGASPGIEDAAARARRRDCDEHLADSLEIDGLGPFLARWEDQAVLRPAHPLAPPVAASVRATRLSHDPLGLAACLRSLGQGACDPVWSRLGELRPPTMIVHGAADAPYAVHSRRMTQEIPGARLTAIAQAAHAVHRERPAETMAAIASFLGR